MAERPSFGKFRTGVSSPYGTGTTDEERRVGSPEGQSKPGLVLLFAPNYAQFAAAYVFQVPELILGRDPTASICIPEQAVSRQHAKIAYLAEQWVLTDLGSRNGTMVDGAFIHERQLEHLHEIRIGDAIFKFVDSGCEKYVGYRIDGTTLGAGLGGLGARKATQLTELVGGAQMDGIAAEIERIAKTELSCMVLGETGTGKEVVARGIHRVSGRKGSFQAVNCAAIPHNLLESELFGYRRGAFSGADRDKPGLVKLADGGTLFLDEIGDMPLDAQSKLLRVLQMREVFPLGGTTPEKVDIRVVCATHRDLQAHVASGKFRGDLFARLNEHVVRLPPLRERKEDVYLLAKAFAQRYGKPELAFTFSAMVALVHYDWPFNVRELESCIKRGVALTDGRPLDAPQLPDAIVEFMKGYGERRRNMEPSVIPPPPVGLPGAGVVALPAPPGVPAAGGASALADARRSAPTEAELRELLVRHHGNVAAVGRELGKERMQIHRWLKRYNIDLDQYRVE